MGDPHPHPHPPTYTAHQVLLAVRKPPNRIRIHTQIIRPLGFILPINRNHLLRAHLIEPKPLHARLALDAKDLVLAQARPVRRVRRTARDVVVLEEGIQAAAVDHHVLRVEHAQPVRVANAAGRACGVVVWVSEGVGAAVGLVFGVGGRHVVGRFGLDEACEDVLGVVELVLVQGMMLNTTSP